MTEWLSGIDISTVIALMAFVVSLYFGRHSKKDSRNTLGLAMMSDCQSRFDNCDRILDKLSKNGDSIEGDERRQYVDRILNNMEYYAYLVNHKYLTPDESEFHKAWFMIAYDTLKEDIEVQTAKNSSVFTEITHLYAKYSKTKWFGILGKD